MVNQFSFKIFRKFDYELEKLWSTFEKNKSCFFYQKIDYIKNLTNISKNSQLMIVVIYEKKLPIILCPLEIKKLYGMRILQWIGTIESDYCAPILSNLSNLEEITFKKIWKRILKEIKDYDLIFLKKQPEYIEKIQNPFAIHLKNVFQSKVYQIYLNGDMEYYLRSITNKKFLSEFKRTEKKLFSDFEVKFEHFTKSQNSLKPSDLIKQKKLILEEKKIKHFLDENFMNLHDKIYKKLEENYLISVLKINGIKVAANLGFINNDRLYYFMPIIYSSKFNSYSPGKVLIYELIKLAHKKKLKFFDFGYGEENYKRYWSNSSESLFYYIQPNSLKGIFFIIFFNFYIKFKRFID